MQNKIKPCPALHILLIIELKMGNEGMEMEDRRTLVVETLSKSPMIAFVLAKRHFGKGAATIPAAGMVSLAVAGANISSLWGISDPIENNSLQQ